MAHPSESLRGYGKEALERDGWKCRYCGLDCSSFELYLLLSVDHVIPWQQQNEVSVNLGDTRNLVACCRACNSFENRSKFNIPKGVSFEEQVEAVLRQKRARILAKREEWRPFYDAEVLPRLKVGRGSPTKPILGDVSMVDPKKIQRQMYILGRGIGYFEYIKARALPVDHLVAFERWKDMKGSMAVLNMHDLLEEAERFAQWDSALAKRDSDIALGSMFTEFTEVEDRIEGEYKKKARSFYLLGKEASALMDLGTQDDVASHTFQVIRSLRSSGIDSLVKKYLIVAWTEIETGPFSKGSLDFVLSVLDRYFRSYGSERAIQIAQGIEKARLPHSTEDWSPEAVWGYWREILQGNDKRSAHQSVEWYEGEDEEKGADEREEEMS